MKLKIIFHIKFNLYLSPEINILVVSLSEFLYIKWSIMAHPILWNLY